MLNPQQEIAVKYIDGPLLVLAGAGSGKTRVITQKIDYLIRGCGYKANTIFALTFTNKAATEMRQRLSLTLDKSLRRGLTVSTFHTLGLEFLKKELKHTYLRPGFSIFDSEDTRQMLRSLMPDALAQDKDLVSQFQHQISLWKNEMLKPEELKNEQGFLSQARFEQALNLYKAYQKALSSYNGLDFDDLIFLPVFILRSQPEVLNRWQNKVRYLLIDEYQDSNTSQYLLVSLLTGLRKQFTVVGDDDQSIYAWRGAKPENLALLQEDYPNLKIIKLEQNYRSSQLILRAANSLIAHNQHIFSKNLWSNLAEGEPLRVLCCRDEQHEAEQVIADLISHRLRYSRDYGDFAILYRGNHQSRLFEKMLRQHGINYRLSGGQSFFSQAEIKDIFAYLKLLANPSDDASFLRVINTPKRGIGEASLDALANYSCSRGLSLYQASSHLALLNMMTEKPRQALQAFGDWMEGLKRSLSTKPTLEVLKQMVHETGYEAYLYEENENSLKGQKKMEAIWELIEWIGRLLAKDESSTLTEVINKLILIDMLDQAETEDKNSVQLMTLHACKGLEFPYVYLVGMEENLLPHRVSIEDEQIEEERRLAYVGITRAQKWLCFSLAKQRRRAQSLEDCKPSRFLDELPQELLQWHGKNTETNPDQSKAIAKTHLSFLKDLLKEGG